MIQPVIVQAESQVERVQHLVKYCKDLDGTEVVVLERVYGTDLPYPHCNNIAFAYAAQAFKGKPFFWLEPDSIPLKSGWLRDLSYEWTKSGKDFMLSSDQRQPYDMVGGIGIYGPETHWLIPNQFNFGGWDGWMIRNLNPIIHRTPFIQHSYGSYEQPGLPRDQAVPHRFPAEISMIRPSARIFHRDVNQDLILNDCKQPRLRFLHSGDIGDIIAAMPIIRQLGGGDLVITEMPPVPGKMPRESMRGARFNSLLPLLRNESYIGDIEWQDSPTDITHDLTQFRIQGWNGKENLAEWQARALSMSSLDMSPWLTIPRSPSGRIVVSRSLRYQNPTFPWKEVDERYGSRLLFIGLKEEMSAFRRLLGHHVDWVPTDNFLEVAEHIKASTLFIGNQSAPFWIAAGLGHNLIQEVWDREPNSIVQRKNASYIYEGFPLPPL